MKIPFYKRKYTFLIVPDSGKSTVRLRIPRLLPVFLLLVVLAMAASIVYLNEIHQRNLEVLQSLEEKLSLKESELNETIIAKNARIEKLQQEILSLSEQAAQVQMKIDELAELEQELRGLTGETASNKTNPVTVASSSSSGEARDMGGEFQEVDDFDAFADFTLNRLIALDGQIDQLHEDLIEARDEVLEYMHQQRITPSIWPLDKRRITSSFGYRKDPFTGRASYHSGIDLDGNTGDRVYATADGQVIHAQYDTGKGYNIIINHGGGIKTHYMHLSKIIVKKGDKVQKGDVIGHVGSTGRSTGSHLHYEVIKNGTPVDPRPYMKN
jgi:murein DD-endopeptidase MepM/ murein hydrolase activator NlpD